ncbi:MAG: hypothetical protein ABIH26_02840 [Candidatus Eisenbacteria bacterium]
MRARAVLCAIGIVLLASGAYGGEERWLHVFVEEKGEGGETIRVNLPFELLESILEVVDTDEISGGKIRIDEGDLDTEEIRAILKAVGKAKEGEYVTVDGVDENVRVSKKGDFLLVCVREGKGEGSDEETVDVRLHLSVLEALASGDGEELDVLAAMRALGEKGGGEVVVVNEKDSTVRIWVDGEPGGEER